MCWDEAWEEQAWFTWFGREAARREGADGASPGGWDTNEGQRAVDEAIAVLREPPLNPAPSLIGLLLARWRGRRPRPASSESESGEADSELLVESSRR